MTSGIVDTSSPSEQHAPPACGCAETHVRSRKLAFLRVDLPADRVAAENIADGFRDVARGLYVLQDHLNAEGHRDEGALVNVLRERLTAEVEALDLLFEMEVIVEDDGGEEEPAVEPNLSLRLAPEGAANG
jgi:hypothetical protein